MKVSAKKIRTPDEEYEYLNNELRESGNFFAWEEHPNRVRATNIRQARLQKQIKELVASEEYKHYNQKYYT